MIDNLINRYFDDLFEGLNLNQYHDANYEWIGVGKKDDFDSMILGYTPPNKNQWYYNGTYFYYAWEYFSMDRREFIEKLKKYVEERYGVKIKYLD